MVMVVGVAGDEEPAEVPRLYGATVGLACVFLVIKGSNTPRNSRRPLPEREHVHGDLFHAHRTSRSPYHRGDHRQLLPAGSREQDVEDRSGTVSRTGSKSPASTGTLWTSSGYFCSRPLLYSRSLSLETASAESIRKHVRVYVTVFVALMGLTLITVAISTLHLGTVAASSWPSSSRH